MWNRNDNILKDYLDNLLIKCKNGIIGRLFSKVANILNSKTCATVFLVLLFILTFLKLIYLINILFTFYDSHTFYAISRSIFVNNLGDFGKINMARSFQDGFDSFRNSGFPLLFPFLMACFNSVFDIGISSGIAINYLVFVIIFFVNLKISLKATNSVICGIIANIILMNIYALDIELVGGFSMPLSILFYQLIVYIFLFNDKIDVKLALLLGLIAGLNINNRFDSYLAMFSIIIVINLKNKRVSLKESFIYFCMLIVFLLPWIIYSKLFFGVYFASDNSRAMITTVEDHLFYYFPHKIPTFFNDTLNWIKIYFFKKLPLSFVSLFLMLISNLFYILPVFFLKRNDFRDKKSLTYSYIVLLLPFLVLFGICSLSGFFWELRYFIPIIWFLSIIIIFYEPKNKIIFRLIALVMIITFSITTLLNFAIYLNNYSYFKNTSESFLNKDKYESLIKNLDENSTILFLYSKTKMVCEMSTMFDNVRFISFPANVYEKSEYLENFINEHEFNYIYIQNNNFDKFNLENEIFKMNDECNTDYYHSKVRLNLTKEYEYNCPLIFDPKVGTVVVPDFNINIFRILKHNFKIIPTKDKNLFKVIRIKNTNIVK